MIAQLSLHSPLGDLTVSEEDGAIVSLDWGWAPAQWQRETPVLRQARAWLADYFDAKRPDGRDLPLRPAGSDFQRRVCAAISAIAYGETATYGDISRRLSSSPRAVGRACAGNPIPILIPCHRVLGAGGVLGGYSGDGGIETKAALLRLEGVKGFRADDKPAAGQ